MALARNIAGTGPDLVQNPDNPSSVPSVRLDSTTYASGVTQTTNKASSTIPTDHVIPTASSSHNDGDTAIIRYSSMTGSLTVTSLLTASGRPHPTGTVSSQSTVRNGGTSTSTQTSRLNRTMSAGSGAVRGQVKHVGVVNVVVVAMMAVGVFGGMVVL